MTIMNKILLNFTEAQKQLGISRSTLLRWLKDKRITGYKAGKKWKFYPADLAKVVLKESPAVYTKSDSKELLKLLNPLFTEKIKCRDIYSPDFWCEWQDIDQWAMITIHIKGNSARIELIQNRLKDSVKHLNIPVSKAVKINRIWEIWGDNDSNPPQRPGKYSCISGNGYKISTLQISAHIKHTLYRQIISKKIETKITNSSYCDIYIYGPPDRHIPLAAYLILSKLIEKNKAKHTSVLTTENEPTYFLPGALQIYGKTSQIFIGTQFYLAQIESSDLLPPRGISSPLFRIAYVFGKRPKKLAEKDNVIIAERLKTE